MVRVCSFLSSPLALNPTQVVVQTAVEDKYKRRRRHAVGVLGSVHSEELVEERCTLGNREFLGKSVTATQ